MSQDGETKLVMHFQLLTNSVTIMNYLKKDLKKEETPIHFIC